MTDILYLMREEHAMEGQIKSTAEAEDFHQQMDGLKQEGADNEQDEETILAFIPMGFPYFFAYGHYVLHITRFYLDRSLCLFR